MRQKSSLVDFLLKSDSQSAIRSVYEETRSRVGVYRYHLQSEEETRFNANRVWEAFAHNGPGAVQFSGPCDREVNATADP